MKPTHVVATLLLALTVFALHAAVDAHGSHTRDVAEIPSSLLAAKRQATPTHVAARNPPVLSGIFTKVIDVTPMLNASAPGDVTTDLHPTFMLETTTETVEKHYFEKKSFTLAGAMGLHVDTPAHLYGSSVRTIDEINPSELVSRLVLIDVRNKVATNPDYQVSVQDLQKWEQQHGRIRNGSLVVMKSGWSSRYYNEALYRNADAQGVQHFPGFSGAAASWLVDHRDINGVGVDTLSIDAGANPYYNVHYTILGSNHIGVENLDMSDPRIPAHGAYIITLPGKAQDAPEFITRAIVLAP